MKIVVNDIAASSGGALTILRDFYSYIVDNDKENEWIFLLNDYYIEEKDNIRVITVPKVKKSWSRRLIFDIRSGSRYIRKLKPDVVFSLQNTITFGLNCRQILYLHQPIPFQRAKRFSLLKKDERTLAIYQYFIGYIIKLSVKKANFVIVQSKWMLLAVLDKVKIEKEKIMCIPPSIEHKSSNNVSKINTKQFFYPASAIIYKNHRCILEACRILNSKGINDFSVLLTIDKLNDIDNNRCITFLGNIERDMVMDIYRTSVLIFPSYIETYGLPLAEARQMNTLILASNCPFAREILEGYKNAYFFDPFQPHQLAELMLRVMNNDISVYKHSDPFNNNSGNWSKIVDIIKM